jgi:hypothetical protein
MIVYVFVMIQQETVIVSVALMAKVQITIAAVPLVAF